MTGERRAAALSGPSSGRPAALACRRIRRGRGGGSGIWGCGCSRRPGRVRRGSRGLRRGGCWRRCGGGGGSRSSRRPLSLVRLTRWCGTRCGNGVWRCGGSSGRCRGRGRCCFGAVRRRARGSRGAFPLVLVRLSRGRRVGRDRRLWRNWRRRCCGRDGVHRGCGRGRSMWRRGGRRRRARRRCSGGRGYRLGRGRGRRRRRRGVWGCRGRRRGVRGRRRSRRRMRRGGRCGMWRRGCLGRCALLLAFRRLLRFSVRTEFALWSLCNDDRSGLRVRWRAYEVQRRQRR
jgi:hypothetical protein